MLHFTIEGTKVSEEQVKDYYRAVWQQADGYYTQHVVSEWDKNDKMYEDIYELPFDKLDWQSDVKTPITDNLVTRLSNFMTRVLVSTNEDYFDVKHPDQDREVAYGNHVGAVLRDNRFPIQVFSPSFSRGLINSVYANKVVFVSEEKTFPVFNEETRVFEMETQTVSRTKILTVHPRHIRLDPNGESYIIESCPDIPLHEYEDMSRQNGWSNIKKVRDEVTSPDGTHDSNYLPMVHLKYVYTKALTGTDGDALLRDVFFVIVNEETVVHVEKNILPDGMFPYVVENPLQSLFGRYGRAYISKIRSLIVNYIESINLLMDAFRLSALGIYEYDTSLASADGAHVFTAQLKPGAFYPKNGAGQILRGVFNNGLQNSSALQVVFFLDRELQNRSYQNEFFMGQPTAKGRPTLGEVSIKSEETNTFFTDIASYIEDRVIQKVLWLVLVTELIHFDDETKIDLTQGMDDQSAIRRIQSLSFTERMADVRNMTLDVRGVSGKIRRLNSFNRFIQVFSVLGNIPGVLQTMRADQVLAKIFEVIDDTPDEFFNVVQLAQGMQQPQQTQGDGGETPPAQGPQAPPTGGVV